MELKIAYFFGISVFLTVFFFFFELKNIRQKVSTHKSLLLQSFWSAHLMDILLSHKTRGMVVKQLNRCWQFL